MRPIPLALACLAVAGSAASQAPLAPDGPSMPEYLSVLQQIAPAARDGTEAYLQAFARRCGRELTVAELRRRLADGSGDPLLLQMVRAAHARDLAALEALAASVRCGARG